ncbi:unnamed protein product [Schistosoma curassoni]|uniref:Ovule protein n=1 Tax=Schistosoma curassoni TaxID=6186 RepID=A0A183JSM9_9TREM|nr:unnamed protein product [Schistosoma curassoni]
MNVLRSDADVKVRTGKAMVAFPTIEEYVELRSTVCQPTSKSEFSMRTSRQFFYTELKLGELPQPSSKMYKY